MGGCWGILSRVVDGLIDKGGFSVGIDRHQAGRAVVDSSASEARASPWARSRTPRRSEAATVPRVTQKRESVKFADPNYRSRFAQRRGYRRAARGPMRSRQNEQEE